MGFHNADLLAQGLSGCVNFLSTWVAFVYLDRFGRRPMLLVGALGMALGMLLLSVLGVQYSSGSADDVTIDKYAGLKTGGREWLNCL